MHHHRQSPYRLVPVPEALEIVLSNSNVGQPEEVDLKVEQWHLLLTLQDALGLIVAASVASPEPMPPFPASVMDGYAVIAEVEGTSSSSHRCRTAQEHSLLLVLYPLVLSQPWKLCQGKLPRSPLAHQYQKAQMQS